MKEKFNFRGNTRSPRFNLEAKNEANAMSLLPAKWMRALSGERKTGSRVTIEITTGVTVA